MLDLLYEINFKENGIKIRVTDDNGIKNIEIIDAKDCNIVYNGKTILENTKSEFSIIPIQIRNQVQEYISHIEISTDDKKMTNFDMDICGVEYSCTVEKIVVNEETAFFKMNNWFNSYEKIVCFNEKINTKRYENKYKKKVKELEDIATNNGYRFRYSHNGDSYDECYSLYIPIKDFDLEKVKLFLRLWNDYNDDLNKYIKK